MIKDKHRKHLTRKYVRELFDYNTATGKLIHKTNRGNAVIGKQAGVIGKRGRRVLCINEVKYYASRVIWLWMTGRWPKKEIDHKNLNKADDRWKNLRQATRWQNGANRISVNNKHGFCGVKQQSKYPGRKTFRFYASIKVGKRDIYLGRFDTAVEAARAYDHGALRYFGPFARLNFPRAAHADR